MKKNKHIDNVRIIIFIFFCIYVILRLSFTGLPISLIMVKRIIYN